MGLITSSFMNQMATIQTMNAQYGLINGANQMMSLANQAANVAISNPGLIDGGGGFGGMGMGQLQSPHGGMMQQRQGFGGGGDYMTSLYQQERSLILAQQQNQIRLKMNEALQESSKKLVDKYAGQAGQYLNTTA